MTEATSPPRKVRPAITLSRDGLPPEVLFGRKCVVGRTAQRQVAKVVLSSSRERLQVVELEMVGFAATHPAGVDEGAATSVALEDRASEPCRHMPALAR